MKDSNTAPPKAGDIQAVLGVGKHKRRAWKGKILIWTALILFGAAGVYAWASGGETQDAVRFATEPVARGDLTVTVTATGTVQPTNEVEISSELSGTVRKVNFDFNDQVKAGDVLAELATETLKAQVDRWRAALAAAKAKVVQAQTTITEKKRHYERISTLAARKISTETAHDVAKAEYERALASLESAKADVEVAQAELKLHEINLGKTRIYSPISGIVLKRNVEPGQTVASSLQAPVLFTLAEDLQRMELRVDINEADIGKVRQGQEANFTVEAYDERKFPARIQMVRFAPETVQGVVTYKGVLGFDNSELLLRPGMTATATIIVDEVKEALLAPNAALRFTPAPQAGRGGRRGGGGIMDSLLFRMPRFRGPSSRRDETGSRRRVWILRDGKPEAVPVVTGATDGQKTQIVKGDIAPGEALIVDAAPPRG